MRPARLRVHGVVPPGSTRSGRSSPPPPHAASDASAPPSGSEPRGGQPQHGSQTSSRDVTGSVASRFLRRRRGLLRHGAPPALLAADVSACVVGLLLAGADTEWMVVFSAFLVGLFATARLYRPRLNLALLEDLPTLLGRWLSALALTVLLQTAVAQVRWEVDVVDWTLVLGAALAFGASVLFRGLTYALVRTCRSRGLVAHRTVIVGAGHVGGQVGDILLSHPEYGLRPVGFVDSRPHLPADHASPPVLGGDDDLADILLEQGARTVVVAFGHLPGHDLVSVLRTCGRLRCEIFVIPRLFEVSHVSDDMDVVWGMPLVRLSRHAHRSVSWRVKRAVDRAAAAAALAVLALPMLAVALAVRLEGGPGVLFRQERVGADGRRFELIKFRSLRPVDETESATSWNIANDARLGPVGRFLRKTSIDELPQLLNIVRGEMSFVGPRPERPHFVVQFHNAYPHYGARHRVPSGLTGLAQVNGLRGDTSITERARFDNVYIENWSLWLDVKIILRTFGAVLRAEGG